MKRVDSYGVANVAEHAGQRPKSLLDSGGPMRPLMWLVAVALVGVVPGVMPVAAHHSFAAEFDKDQKITLKGIITKMDWVNPHSWLYINVKGPDGQMQEWELEFGAPNALFRRGWKKDSLPIGTEVTVTAYRAKTLPHRANAEDVILPDGKTLFAGSSGTGAPSDRK